MRAIKKKLKKKKIHDKWFEQNGKKTGIQTAHTENKRESTIV